MEVLGAEEATKIELSFHKVIIYHDLMDIKKALIIVVLVILAAALYKSKQPVRLGSGIKAPEAPLQTNIDSAKPFDHDGYQITPLAEFEAKVKLLSKKDYSYDPSSVISPTDFAVGWGRLSDESILDSIEFEQSARWLHYKMNKAPIEIKELQTHATNIHLIPANDSIARQIKRVKRGQIIKITGKLVFVYSSEKNFQWRSSLSRYDVGDGACEVLYLESLTTIEG